MNRVEEGPIGPEELWSQTNEPGNDTSAGNFCRALKMDHPPASKLKHVLRAAIEGVETSPGTNEAFERFLNEREQQVLSNRLGISGAPSRLDDLGNELGIRRQGVRRIEWRSAKRVLEGLYDRSYLIDNDRVRTRIEAIKEGRLHQH